MLIGAVTAAGEASALVLRLFSGPAADRSHRYWAWAIGGYVITVIAVPGLALPLGVAGASALFIAERVGKAVRSPAKDALLAHAGTTVGRGMAFAVHEALDQTGAFAGPLLIAGAYALTGGYGTGFALLAVPGVLAVALLLWLARKVPEPAGYEDATTEEFPASPTGLPTAFWRYAAFASLTMAGFATFGLIGYHFSSQHLMAVSLIPVVYSVAMATDAVAALATGKLFDRYGFNTIAVLPVLAGAGTCLAFTPHVVSAIVGTCIWGAALGVQESTLRAGIASIVAPDRRASAYGVFAAAYGVAWLVGGTLLGFLYDQSLAALVIVCVAFQTAAVLLLLGTRQPARTP